MKSTAKINIIPFLIFSGVLTSCGNNTTKSSSITSIPDETTSTTTEEEHTHNFGDWVKTIPETCITDGEETRTCPCGKTETRPVTAKGHNPSTEWTSDTVSHWHTCANDANEKLDEAQHVFDQDVQDDLYLIHEATPTSLKSFYKSCVCGYSSSDASQSFVVGAYIEPKGMFVSEKPTETSIGYVTYYYDGFDDVVFAIPELSNSQFWSCLDLSTECDPTRKVFTLKSNIASAGVDAFVNAHETNPEIAMFLKAQFLNEGTLSELQISCGAETVTHSGTPLNNENPAYKVSEGSKTEATVYHQTCSKCKEALETTFMAPGVLPINASITEKPNETTKGKMTLFYEDGENIDVILPETNSLMYQILNCHFVLKTAAEIKTESETTAYTYFKTIQYQENVSEGFFYNLDAFLSNNPNQKIIFADYAHNYSFVESGKEVNLVCSFDQNHVISCVRYYNGYGRVTNVGAIAGRGLIVTVTLNVDIQINELAYMFSKKGIIKDSAISGIEIDGVQKNFASAGQEIVLLLKNSINGDIEVGDYLLVDHYSR